MPQAAQLVLMVVVIPLWIGMGLVDWWCHRRTRIEDTSGVPENVFHWFLLAEGGLALLATALLEINAAVLLLVFAAFLAHEATTFIELRYTVPLRDVRPFEQMVHSFMEILPLLALALLAVLAWPQAQALFGLDAEAADWSLRAKQEPLPGPYVAGAILLMLAFNTAPLFQETWACWRARKGASPGPRARTPPRPGPR